MNSAAQMKVGDLVKPANLDPSKGTPLVDEGWRGIIIGWDGIDPIVFWNLDFPEEREYAYQLEVVNEISN